MQNVTDYRSNPKEQLVYASESVGRSELKRRVFRAIYFGKTKTKTIGEIAKSTKLSRKQVLNAAKKLHTTQVIHQTKVKGELAYKKDDALSGVWRKILNYSGDNKKISKIVTKSNPKTTTKIVTIKVATSKVRIKSITIDDVDSFIKVKKIKKINLSSSKIPEAKFKKGILKILKENGPPPKDWGGEKNDIYTNKLKIANSRFHAAFALKGPGKKAKVLTPKDMGKNGDQIQRLHRSPAQVFFVQYWRKIDQSVIELMEQLSIAKSYSEGRCIYYGIIDGNDSSRLIQAYPSAFK